jgi:tetratricopeptide (TPR) repeat protein
MAGATAFAQDVGADVGAGAGIFRARNPETKKSPKPTAGTKPPSRTTGPTRPARSNVAERVEDLLDKGNEARDARRFTEAEDAYKEVLKLTPRDARAAYGLGNVYSDQQRWPEAEAAYRNSVTWAPTNADAYIALSVVLVQPRVDGDNAKRFRRRCC